MTKEQTESLNLGITPIDSKTVLIVESALEWVKEHTNLEFDITNTDDIQALPSSVRLFIIKFFDIQMLNTGVASESIEGLSQSYDTTDKTALLWQFAEELLSAWLKPRIRFVSAVNSWK